MAQFRCHLAITAAGVNPPLDTSALFDAKHKESTDSPISQFLNNLQSINRLAPQPNSFDPYQGQLVLLGVIAAVESYVRMVFRRVIVLDARAKYSSYDQEVSYGAALHLKPDLMPEALLERYTFISSKSIEEALRKLLAVKGELPPELRLAIADYSRVCQMRHCAVHRFGRLGARNAIELGLETHKQLLEKPLRLDYAALQNSIAIATCFVKTLNGFLFNELLSRVDHSVWTGTYQKDKAHFKKFYELFAAKSGSTKSAAPRVYYRQFLEEFQAWKAGAGRS